MATYTIKILATHTGAEPSDEVWLDTVRNYKVQNIGKTVNRVQFVNNNLVYYQELPYNPAFVDISFTGMAELATCQKLEGWYNTTQEANDIKFVDSYGHTYNKCFIKSFNFDWVKAKGAYVFSIELVHIYNTSYLFKVGGSSVLYGVESCEISQKMADIETLISPMTQKYIVKQYATKLYEIRMSGTELIDSSTKEGKYSGPLTTAVSSITFPNGKILSALLLDKQTSLIAGQAGFQKFSVSFVASDSTSNLISDSGTLIDSYTLSDESGRMSEHKTIGGYVLQKFTNVGLLKVNISVYTNDDTPYRAGAELSSFKFGYVNSSGIEVTYTKGYVLGVPSITPVQGSSKIKKVNAMIAIPTG